MDDFEDTCEVVDKDQFPASDISQSDTSGNYSKYQIYQALAPSMKGNIIERYQSSPMLVKTRMIPIEIFKKIVNSNKELFGFSVIQKGANDKREGLKLNFGGNFTPMEPSELEAVLLEDCPHNIKKFSLSSRANAIKSQMDTLIQDYQIEKPTFEEEFDLKIQLYRREELPGLEIINWQWVRKDEKEEDHKIRTKRRRSSSDTIIEGNLTVQKNAEIAGCLNVRSDIKAAKISTHGADLAEWRPICEETNKLFGEIDSPCGRVVIWAEKTEYTIRIPKHVKEGYEISVVSSDPGMIIGEQNKTRFQYNAKIVSDGYAPVCVIGDVRKNDYLIPSGKDDGTAKAWTGNENSLIFAMAAENGNEETGMVHAHIYRRPYPRPARLRDATSNLDQLVKHVIIELKEKDETAQTLIYQRCKNIKNLSPKNYHEKILDILKTARKDHDRIFTKFKKALTAEIRRLESLATTSEPRSINLRSYQKELVRRAKDRARSIIVLPTGTGKTFVAAEVMYQRLKKMEDKICIFLSTTIPLQMQQTYELREYISSRNKRIDVKPLASDATNQHALLRSKNTVYVMTAGGFNNVVTTEELLNHIVLLVADEIHHLECNNKKHYYNKIVEKWHRVDRLGLTATPAASITDDSTSKKFDSLLEIFGTDNHGFLQVIDEKEDLDRFCTEIKFTTQCVVMDSADKECIRVLEKFIVNLERSLEDNVSFTLIFPDVKNVYGYQVQVTAMAKEILEKMKGDQKAIIYRSQLIFLSYLSEGLSLVKNLGHKYSYMHISKRGKNSILTDGSDDCNEFLKDVGNLLHELESAESANSEDQHPKFMEMKKVILSFIAQSNENRCKVLVFANTRRVVTELSRRINIDKDFISKNIRSDFLLGSSSNRRPDRPNGLNMSQDEQLKILRDFKYGEVDVLVATTIAEEGIDITKCNLVIQYDVSSSGKCLQQRAGRARALNPVVHSIYYADEDKKIDEAKALYKSEVELDRMNDQIQRRANNLKKMNTP